MFHSINNKTTGVQFKLYAGNFIPKSLYRKFGSLLLG